jgi:cysteine dioxygenase
MTKIIKNPIKYKTLDKVVTALLEEDKATYSDIFNSIDLPENAFEPCSFWCSEKYTRNCIIENDEFELILICWEKGQITPIHDHGGEECWVKVVQGELKETIYKMDGAGELNKVKSSNLKAGDVSYMIDFMGCHCLGNLTGDRCMSLHLYAKPIRNCQLFDERTKKFTQKKLSYSTVSDLMTKFKT